MIQYKYELKTFQEFSYFILDITEGIDDTIKVAYLIIADPNLINARLEYKNASIGKINRTCEIRVILIENINELKLLISSKFSGLNLSKYAPKSLSSKVVGIYGVFDYFMKQGDLALEEGVQLDVFENSTVDRFLKAEEYSGKTVNYICYLLHRLTNINYEVFLSEPDVMATGKYIPSLWNKRIPNLWTMNPDQYCKKFEKISDQFISNNKIKKSVRGTEEKEGLAKEKKESKGNLVPLGLILSKWVSL